MPPKDKRKRGPPCVAEPLCDDPDSDSGQWTFVKDPKGLCREGAVPEALLVAADACVCKKNGCRRWAGILPPAKKAGRPSKMQQVTVARPLREVDTLPRKPILMRIDEIWA